MHSTYQYILWTGTHQNARWNRRNCFDLVGNSENPTHGRSPFLNFHSFTSIAAGGLLQRAKESFAALDIGITHALADSLDDVSAICTEHCVLH